MPDWCAQSLVLKSCSRKKVVEPVGKNSLALDTVFGYDLEKEETQLCKAVAVSLSVLVFCVFTCLFDSYSDIRHRDLTENKLTALPDGWLPLKSKLNWL